MIYWVMDYKTGLPKFSPEKPQKLIYGNPMLEFIQDSGRFVGQFKLDEHRGFLCIDHDYNINHYSYRGGVHQVDEELKQIIKSFSLPACTVLDSGFLKLKKLGDNPYLYVFDILVWEGQKVWGKLEDRLKLFDRVLSTRGRLLTPIQVPDFLKQFELLMNNECDLAKKVADLYNIDYELLRPLIEGFVIKDLNGTHTFPSSVKKSSNFYKLRLEDLPKEIKK